MKDFYIKMLCEYFNAWQISIGTAAGDSNKESFDNYMTLYRAVTK